MYSFLYSTILASGIYSAALFSFSSLIMPILFSYSRCHALVSASNCPLGEISSGSSFSIYAKTFGLKLLAFIFWSMVQSSATATESTKNARLQ